MSTTLARVRQFFQEFLGFALVIDTTFARNIALRELRQEFQEHRKYYAAQEGKSSDALVLNTPPPLLSSACPGWICYVEKTQASLLPLLSRVKSPQQITGAILKRWWSYKQKKKYVPRLCYLLTLGPGLREVLA